MSVVLFLGIDYNMHIIFPWFHPLNTYVVRISGLKFKIILWYAYNEYSVVKCTVSKYTMSQPTTCSDRKWILLKLNPIIHVDKWFCGSCNERLWLQRLACFLLRVDIQRPYGNFTIKIEKITLDIHVYIYMYMILMKYA